MSEFHLSESGKFKEALGKLCREERRLSSNAAAPNPTLEIEFRKAALAFVAAYRAASADPCNANHSGVT